MIKKFINKFVAGFEKFMSTSPLPSVLTAVCDIRILIKEFNDRIVPLVKEYKHGKFTRLQFLKDCFAEAALILM